MPDKAETPTSGAGMLARIYWLFAGNVLLFFLLVFIFEERAGVLSLYDAAYGLATASLLGVRFIDIRFLNGQDGEGQPATMKDWRRYALTLVPLAGGAWLLVHILGIGRR